MRPLIKEVSRLASIITEKYLTSVNMHDHKLQLFCLKCHASTLQVVQLYNYPLSYIVEKNFVHIFVLMITMGIDYGGYYYFSCYLKGVTVKAEGKREHCIS